MGVKHVKNAVRKRDGYRCTQCGMTQEQHNDLYGRGLEVHRIDPGSVYTVDGCQTVCRACHYGLPRLPWGERLERLRKCPYATYTTVQLDRDVLHAVKIAAAMTGKFSQEWLSDVANEAASAQIGQSPIKRRPRKPPEERTYE